MKEHPFGDPVLVLAADEQLEIPAVVLELRGRGEKYLDRVGHE
jgi:hypothetical protein